MKCSPVSGTVVALPYFESDSDRDNLGSIVKRKAERAQRRLSQVRVTNVTVMKFGAGKDKDAGHLARVLEWSVQKKIAEK